MKHLSILKYLFSLLCIAGINASAQNVTITAGTMDCDNYGNNDIRFSPSSFTSNGTQQKVTITFKQYQCERCKQIVFTKNGGNAVNLSQDVASGEFTVTGIQKNPPPVSNPEVTDNKLSFHGLDCGWDVGDVSLSMYLKYEEATNTLYYSSNPIGSEGGSGDDGNGNDNNNNTTNSVDLILGKGDKQFIFHTQPQNPNDPPVVLIAPKLPNSTDFDWSKQITLKNDGSLLMSAGNLGVGTTTPVARLQVNAEGDPTNLENNMNNGFAIKGDDQILYMGVNSADHVSYIQSVDYGTDVAPLLLNARGGNVGIGTTTPQYKLDINGIIRAHELLVNLYGGADFVFDENYTLRPLDEVHNFIQANKHLPEIPSAANMVENGLDMGEFQIKLLQKIEELTLYIITQEKRIKELEKGMK